MSAHDDARARADHVAAVAADDAAHARDEATVTRRVRVGRCGVETDDGIDPESGKTMEGLRARIRALERLALHDALTGLVNRHGLSAFGDERLRLAREAGTDLIVMLFDVDGLGQVNNGFGHRAGDDALRGVAEALNEVFGPHALLARIGGDEFVAVFEASRFVDPEALVERVARTLVERSEQGATLRVSSGTTRRAWTDERPLLESVWEADAAMYLKRRLRGFETAARA